MDIWLLTQDDFHLACLPEPVIAYNVDGTKNQKGTIHWKAKIIMTLEDCSDLIELMLIKLSQPQVILGLPWLKKWNPKINWNRFSMTLPLSPHHHIPYHIWYLRLDAHHKLSQLFTLWSPAEDTVTGLFVSITFSWESQENR